VIERLRAKAAAAAGGTDSSVARLQVITALDFKNPVRV
jgi:hypothetical protein